MIEIGKTSMEQAHAAAEALKITVTERERRENYKALEKAGIPQLLESWKPPHDDEDMTKFSNNIQIFRHGSPDIIMARVVIAPIEQPGGQQPNSVTLRGFGVSKSSKSDELKIYITTRDGIKEVDIPDDMRDLPLADHLELAAKLAQPTAPSRLEPPTGEVQLSQTPSRGRINNGINPLTWIRNWSIKPPTS